MINLDNVNRLLTEEERIFESIGNLQCWVKLLENELNKLEDELLEHSDSITSIESSIEDSKESYETCTNPSEAEEIYREIDTLSVEHAHSSGEWERVCDQITLIVMDIDDAKSGLNEALASHQSILRDLRQSVSV